MDPQQPAPRRDHLVAVATALFCRDGFHATGIDRVLAESGVAKMTLYKHFPSKDDLIGACLEGVAATSRAAVEQVLARAGRSARAKVLALVRSFAMTCAAPGFSGCAFHHACAEFADRHHPAHRAATEHKRWLRGVLLGLCKEHGQRRPERAADQLLLVIEGALALGPLDTARDLVDATLRLATQVLDGARSE